MSERQDKARQRREMKSEIESLLQTISSAPNESMLADDDLREELTPESPYDFEEMSQGFTDKAREITDSLFKNFVDIGVFGESDYAKIKKELDTVNVSNLFFQLKTLKITIIKVMEQITAGNTHPRMIEVMGQLQDKMANITKMQANYILFLEDTYKRLNNEAPVNSHDSQVGSSKAEGKFFVSVGTKNMVDSLPDVEVDEYESVGKSLVDPGNKNELMRKKNIEIDEEDGGSDDYIDLTEII